MMHDFFVLTPEQRDAAMAFNGAQVAVDPRAIDGRSPGSGLNTNAAAHGYELDSPVALAGNYAAPASIVNDPAYAAGAPGMIEFLLTLPRCSLDIEAVFAPAPAWWE